jgi:hypothetical protein
MNSSIKDHIAYLQSEEGPAAVGQFLTAQANNRELDATYFHHFSQEELAGAAQTTAKKVVEFKQWEKEAAEERKSIKEKTKSLKEDMEKTAESVRVGGLEKTGILYTIFDGEGVAARALVYDKNGNLVDERPLTFEERQRKLELSAPGFDR